MSSENNQEETVEVTKTENVEVKKDVIENTFEQFGFKDNILKGVTEAGFKLPSPIQASSIPKVFTGTDLVAQAHTGTGKTAAFGLPIMDMMTLNAGVECLVIAPTRELANQVSDELFKLGRFKGIKTATVYGGQSYSRQLSRIEQGAQVVVATPGRLLDMLSSGKLRNFAPKFVILDEADEMLDMGFLDDIQEVFTHLPDERQTLLFSATMPMQIKNLAKRILKEPEFVSVTNNETTNKDIKQEYYVIDDYERDDAVTRLLDTASPEKAIIFCRMKREVDRISTMLMGRGYSAKGLHGDMEQRQREEVIRSFKNSNLNILVATDVAARGLDISGVSHVFNYHIPFDPESYVHRIGRTGRAGNKGTAITLVTPMEFRELSKIRKKVGSTIEQSYVPTANDVKDIHLAKFLDKIKHQPINNDVAKIIETLEESMDISQICFKLLSMLIDSKSIKGPNRIGLDEHRVKALIERQKRDDDNRRGGNGGGGGRGRSRGGYRGSRSGGGGYRGNRDGGGGRDGGREK